MNFIADENIDSQVVESLRRRGHDTVYIAELSSGIPDEAVFDQSNTQNRLLITSDRDFGEMVFRQRLVTAGVILVRLAGLSPARKASIVCSAVDSRASELTGKFTVIAPGMIRVRRVEVE